MELQRPEEYNLITMTTTIDAHLTTSIYSLFSHSQVPIHWLQLVSLVGELEVSIVVSPLSLQQGGGEWGAKNRRCLLSA